MTDTDSPQFDGVILAAGRSRRAGAWKPALTVAGKSLLAHAVGGLLPWCRRVVVVVGPEGLKTGDPIAGRPGVTVVVNDRRDEGMFRSVQAGVRSIGSACSGIFIQPVDCPVVPPEVFRTLQETYRSHGQERPVIPCHGGRGGHPVLVPAGLRADILAANPPTTLRDVLARASAVRVPVAFPAVLTDVDTPADLARLRAAVEGGRRS